MNPFTFPSALCLSFLLSSLLPIHAQGPLAPDSAPAPTMKTLTQVEPRTPIPGGGNYTISAPGSYYLTGNIASTGDKFAILIASDDVTLDLNGFTVTGRGIASFNDWGVFINGVKNVVVRNGSIKKAAYGIGMTSVNGAPASGIRIENVNLHELYFSGIYASEAIPALAIIRCHVDKVGGSSVNANSYGIKTSSGARIESCLVDGVHGSSVGSGNGGYGISAASGCFIISNSVSNCDVGFNYGILRENSVYNCTTTYSNGSDAGGNY